MSEIEIAQRLVTGSLSYIGQDRRFHKTSLIYRTTNERIDKYIGHLKNRNRLLSVIASGDQILNSVLADTMNIDAFDISVFPKYFLKLKMAAIKVFNKEEYINFICNENINEELADDMYQEVRKYLDDKAREFWDSLFGFFDIAEIYNSTLFSSESAISSQMIRRNPYLQEDNYEILKQKIDQAHIHYMTGDINNLILPFNYDAVNLSSIMYYQDNYSYQKLLDRINLQEDGEILTYVYDPEYVTRRYKLNGTIVEPFDDGKHGIMIYKKEFRTK